MAWMHNTMRSKWFTLIELMVVVVLIAIISLLGSNIDFNKITNKERSKQFANTVTETIRREVVHAIAGKSVAQWTILAYPTATRISISTNQLSVGYYSGATLLQNGASINFPFRGDPGYAIKAIRVNDGSTNYLLSSSDLLSIELATGKDATMSYTGSISWNAITAELDIAYHGSIQTIQYDRRSNVIKMINP